jgi:hypothetical protein
LNCLNESQLYDLLRAPEADALGHVAACETCAARLAELTMELPTTPPPAGLRGEIARVVYAPPTESFGHYALRAFAAMAAALVLLFSGAFERLATLPQKVLTHQIAAFFEKESDYFAQESE